MRCRKRLERVVGAMMGAKLIRVMLPLVCSMLMLICTEPSISGNEAVDFQRDVRPILSSRCFHCHGPDAEQRAADLQLDRPEGVFADRGGYFVVVPGDLKRSDLIQRITATDADLRMPPPEHKVEMSEKEIEVLKAWVEQGAKWNSHWSFAPIHAPVPPDVAGLSIEASPIDRFVAARLAAMGLEFSPEASKERLLRRVHLDLTGLPPSVEEVEAFLADTSPDAYQKVVRRLLATPECAERLALDWLDAARYADTNGYSIDDHRDMWAWRDWVIRAFERNLPYDRFLTEQIAGDLLPDATPDQHLATGFLRNSMNTHEGGTIPEEYRVAYVADKVDVVSTVFLGLTLKCAQCHDHKYDPLSQRDYYRFFAFFDDTDEPGTGATNGNTEPTIRVASPLLSKEDHAAVLHRRIASLYQNLAHPFGGLEQPFREWQQREREQLVGKELVSRLPFPDGSENAPLPAWIWAAALDQPTVRFRRSFELEKVPQRARLFLTCDNEAEVWINGEAAGKNEHWEKPIELDVVDRLRPGRNLIAIEGKDWGSGEVAALVAVLSMEDEAGQIRHLVSDGTWMGSTEAIEGWNHLESIEGFEAVAVRHPYGAGPWGRPHERLDGGLTAALAEALLAEETARTPAQILALAEAFARVEPDYAKILGSIREEIRVLEHELSQGLPSVMVLRQSANRRETRMLMRGQYDQPGEAVTAGIPEVFGSLPESETADRLALASWLVSREHPLTARVAVNRYWQLLFGTGLVETSEDFGAQGSMPSHPELLDWLAADFMEHRWDVRRLLENILMSQTYRQDSAVSPGLREVDPYARLLTRAPRFRLQAELVRDNALAIGGLLKTELGGPSVYPHQPDGLWRELSHFGHPFAFTAQAYYSDRDAAGYRRSLYTFWKRTSPPPVMSTFDAPSREICVVRRARTNTPLQALVVMNEPQFMEAAGGLAQIALQVTGGDTERLSFAFHRATGRGPSLDEKRVLQRALENERAMMREDAKAAEELLRFTGHTLAEGSDPAELAAWTMVASLILNLDETMTRE